MKEGGGGQPNSGNNLLKKYCFNNRFGIDVKVVITAFYLLFDVIAHVNDHSMYLHTLIFSQSLSFLGCDKEEGIQGIRWQSVAWGRESKISIF